MAYSVSITSSSFVQNAGTTLTLSGQALAGVAITSGSVSIAGDLLLDVSTLDVYDGMSFTLVNATTLSGVWGSVDALGTTNCSQATVNIEYTESSAVATVSTANVCDSASSLIACVAAFASFV